MDIALANPGTGILFVESNLQESALLKEALGCGDSRSVQPMHIAVGAAEAQAFLRRKGRYAKVSSPGLVVLNYDLSEADSRSVVATLRADARLSHIPVVALDDSVDGRASAEDRAPAISFSRLVELAAALRYFWMDVARVPQPPQPRLNFGDPEDL